MEYALADITATRALENVTDFTQYGLDEPQSVISYTTADGASVEILTGDYNDVSGEYYAQLAGEHTVYTVSGDYMEDFQYTIDDLLQVESLPIYEEDTELRVTADGKTTVYDLTKMPEMKRMKPMPTQVTVRTLMRRAVRQRKTVIPYPLRRRLSTAYAV